MDRNAPKVKISRYLGVPITRKASRVMERKPNPPGQAAASKRFRGKMSVFKEQMLEKQKLRAQYNIQEKQMRKYYAEASRLEGNTVENLVQQLERRLDAFIYRAGFAPTIYAARQFVSHAHFTVNGHKVNIPSYQVRVGDIVTIRPKSQKLDMFVRTIGDSSLVVPSYITRNDSECSASLSYLPAREDVAVICNIPLVIEFYSR